MKALSLLPLFLPYLVEVLTEAYYEVKKKVSINHAWSAAWRGAAMITIAGLYQWFHIQNFWPVILMQVAIHFLLFNYTYNRLTGRKWSYLREKGIDRILGEVGPLALLWFQIIFMLWAIVVYFPEINE